MTLQCLCALKWLEQREEVKRKLENQNQVTCRLLDFGVFIE